MNMVGFLRHDGDELHHAALSPWSQSRETTLGPWRALMR